MPVPRPLVAMERASGSAEPSPPWTSSAATRHALELLVDEGGLALTVTQWPLPRAAVVQALDALPRELPPALDAARARVAAELREAPGSQLSITLRGDAEAFSGFGDDATPGSWVGVRSSTLAGHGAVMQLGAHLDGETRSGRNGAQFRLDETAIATELFGQQVQAWAHRDWWGPDWQSSPAEVIRKHIDGTALLVRFSASAEWVAQSSPSYLDTTTKENDITKRNHTHVAATDVRIRKTGACPSLFGKAKLKFELGCSADAELQIRISANSGTGYFNDDWIEWGRLLAILDKHGDKPITSHTLAPLFEACSANSAGFLRLRAHGLNPRVAGRRCPWCVNLGRICSRQYFSHVPFSGTCPTPAWL
jgi:hypothetical protein